MREDRYTNDEAGAADYERARAGGYDDSRPTRAEAEADLALDSRAPWKPEVHRLICHSPVHTQPGGPRVPKCVHCPLCGSDVTSFEGWEFYACSNGDGCSWTHGTNPADPPF